MKRLLLCLTFLGACDPESPDEVGIYELTPAPPGKSATILEDEPSFEQDRGITLTRGVALATRCWETCEYLCREAELVTADPTTLMVRPLLRQGQTPDVEFTLLALKPGTTTLTVRTRCGVKDYPVTVAE